MNKNIFLIILIGLIAIIYIIDNYRLLIKTNENFDAISDNANGNISNTSNTSNVNSELLDLLSKIESEIDQITKSEIKTETESEIKTETESEMIDVSNTGGWITIVVIIILIFCCSSSIMSIFTPSTQTQPVQPIVYQNTPPLPPPVYSYPPQAHPYPPYPPPPNPYS